MNGFGVEAGRHSEHHGLGCSHVVDRDQQVGHVFHAAAVAELAEVVRRARKAGKNRAQATDDFGIAARIDDNVLDLRLRAGAADRAVEHDVTGFGECACGGMLVVERQRAGLDDHARFYARGDNRRDRHRERVGAGQAGDDGRRLGRKLASVRCDLDTGAGERPAALRVDIVADHAPTGGDEVLRKRAAHDAETDDTDAAFVSCHASSRNCRDRANIAPA